MTNTKLEDILIGYVDDGARSNEGDPLLSVREIAAVSLVRQVMVDLEGDAHADPGGDIVVFRDVYVIVSEAAFPDDKHITLISDTNPVGSWTFHQDWRLPVHIPGVTD